MKKLFAVLLAVAMIMSFALTASAVEETLDCTGWWTAHTEGVQVTEEGATITFTSTTYETGTNNWNAPIFILYSGEEAKVNGAGYYEYWVHRADNYGWAGGWAEFKNTGANMAELNDLGVTVDGVYEDACWDNWVADLQAGVECTVTAKLVEGKAVVSITCHGVTNTVSVPVDTSAPIYVSLSGELCTLSNIVVTENEPADEPADGYTAGLSYASSDWGIQTWGTDAFCNVPGAGTYTLSFDTATNGAVVFVIDIGEEGGDAADVLSAYDLTELKVLVDGTEIPVDLSKVVTGNIEEKGRYRIEIYNEYGSTKDNAPIDPTALVGATNLTVTFTLTDPTADPTLPKTGDAIAVVVALMAVSAMGITVMAKKRF